MSMMLSFPISIVSRVTPNNGRMKVFFLKELLTLSEGKRKIIYGPGFFQSYMKSCVCVC